MSFTISPRELIASMSQALRRLNYEGTYVHFHGSNLTTMHILHASHSEGEFKRLSIVDAEECEVVEDDSVVPCVWTSNEALLVSGSKSLDTQLPKQLTSVDSDFYTFSQSKMGKVAGRSAHIVDVESEDNMRYGYRFWIDTETHMLLRSMMFEGDGPPVDQMTFTKIDFPEKIDLARFDTASADGQEVEGAELTVNEGDAAVVSGNEAAVVEQSNVVFKAVPVGYEKVSETLSTMPEIYGPVRHVMFSDGIASISVYVEYLADPDIAVDNFVEGLSKLGSTNAFGVKGRSVLVTAVGEAPEATIKAFANAVVLSE